MPDPNATAGTSTRLRLTITGAVQGVGFRPFVYRLATEMRLTGFVTNNAQGVVIEVEGDPSTLSIFGARLKAELPPLAFILSCESQFLDAIHFADFCIHSSDDSGMRSALILPDIATCPECRSEIFDPADRRYRYPFTNCTNCGPRFSIIEALPYDRTNTSMRSFMMCPLCQAEYNNPRDRRFHAQPNACPDCGPQLALWNRHGKTLATRHDALLAALADINDGRIVAIKGLGGFHLLVDAHDTDAIVKLRQRKRRGNKPLAIMYPHLEMIERDCDLSPAERNLLTSVECPIVLVRRRASALVADNVAPKNPCLGVMLPYTPLHHLLMAELDKPVVATSGNLSEEPICTDEVEALDRLKDIADIFLIHDRPIRRHVDDSIARVIAGRPQIIRRARGYAPLPISLPEKLPTITAVGAHLKSCVAVTQDRNVFISQHIGDLETIESYRAFAGAIDDLSRIFEHSPRIVACDLHPDYRSSRYAHERTSNVHEVQHHYAHVLSCMAENEIDAPVLGISWDGTGLGDDGTIWGGEFLHVKDRSYERVATFRSFRLPGGDAAIKEPRRSAAAVLFELNDGNAGWADGMLAGTFEPAELSNIEAMLRQRINSPITTSAGRLFDAVAALLGISPICTFEGEAAMQLEFAIGNIDTDSAYPIAVVDNGTPIQVDWRPLIRAILSERNAGLSVGVIAARFHNTLVTAMLQVARRIGLPKVVLSGGCFQNRYLTERAIKALRTAGFPVYWHQRVPTNDSGIALGQVLAAARSQERQ